MCRGSRFASLARTTECKQTLRPMQQETGVRGLESQRPVNALYQAQNLLLRLGGDRVHVFKGS
jgi:hypothetical protein